MFKRVFDAVSTWAIEVVTSSFAAAGNKRQRDALENNNSDGGGSAAATGLSVTQHSVTVNRHAL